MGRLRDALKTLLGSAAKAAPPMGALTMWGNTSPWSFPAGEVGYSFARAAGDFSRNGTVSIGLNWLAVNALAGPRLCVGTMDRQSGKYDDNPDHDLIVDLKRPSPFFPASQLIANTVRDLAYPGYSYWIKGTGTLGNLEYYWVPPRTIQPVAAPINASFPIAYYDYMPPGGGPVKRYQPSQIVHFRRGTDPDCFWQGLSPLAAQIRSIAALNAGETWTAAVLRNGHRATLLSPKEGKFTGGDLDQSEIDALRDRIRRHSSGENAGGIEGTATAVDVNALGFSPEEVVIDRILDRPEGMVVASLQLNSLVLALPSSAETRTYSNLAEAKVQAAEFGLKPVLCIISETLQTHVLPDYEGAEPTSEIWWDYTEYAPLQEDADARANRANILFDGGIARLNEAREMAGLTLLEDSDPRGEMFKSEIGMSQAVELQKLTAPSDGDGEGQGQSDQNQLDGTPRPRALNPPEESNANAA